MEIKTMAMTPELGKHPMFSIWLSKILKILKMQRDGSAAMPQSTSFRDDLRRESSVPRAIQPSSGLFHPTKTTARILRIEVYIMSDDFQGIRRINVKTLAD